MGRNFEGNDSAPQKDENESADFNSQAFSTEDQQQVFKRMNETDSKNVGTLDLETLNHEMEHAKRIEFPHAWFESAKKTAFGLPAEAAFSPLDTAIKNGWNKLKN